MPRLSALCTAVPDHVIGQDAARDGARRIFAGRAELFDRMAPVYDNAGIETRRSCVPIDWYHAPHGWPDRNALYLDSALDLLEQAASGCLAAAGLVPGDVDALVVVSSTGIATPSLDAHLMNRLPFRPDVLRLPIFGLGCAGGALGLGRAAALSRAMPGARILLLVVELCGLTFRRSDLTKSNIIATALFGDGAAAALITGDDGPGTILAWGEHTWPASLDVMGWSVETDGLGVIFSKDIPTIIRRDLRPAADTFLARHGLAFGDLDGIICHPGGAKVIEALEDAFDLARGTLETERSVLRRYGNMSAATLPFVLAERRRAGVTGRYLLMALGPGFTAGFLLIDL